MGGNNSLKMQIKLLKKFDKLYGKPLLVILERNGAGEANVLVSKIRADFETLIPQMPDLNGEMSFLKDSLAFAAMQFATYRVLEKEGMDIDKIWLFCEEVMTSWLDQTPGISKWIMEKLTFFSFVKNRVKLASIKSRNRQSDGFVFDFIEGDGKEFDWGVDYHQCAIKEFATLVGAEPLAPYICRSDNALSNAFGWGLKRTKTLALDGDYCDFRFRKNHPTEILK